MKNSILSAILGITVFGLAACDSGGPSSTGGIDGFEFPDETANGTACELPVGEIVNGGPGKDGIPALTDPPLVPAGEAGYLNDNDRVIGVFLNGEPVAIPHNVLWWHEIVNYSAAGDGLAVTYCPLTGSSIVFDRSAIGGAELGVSGLLYNNNLIMYDRNEQEALWSQMLSGAGCESSKNVSLTTVAHVEMSWRGWKSLYPGTSVISSSTGFSRNYQRYPYGDYEVESNTELLFRQPAYSDSRPPKERVLGIPGGSGRALLFPFGKLEETGALAAVSDQFEGRNVIVLWDTEKRAAAAFEPRTLNGDPVQIRVQNGQFVDQATGSLWQVDGLAISGSLSGQRLEPVAEAYVAFWFAWATFHPEARIFG